MAERKKRYVYKSTVKGVYGLTDKMIRDLGEPDKVVKNPHYLSGPPASLYLIARVESWCDEHKEMLQEAREKRATRSAAAKKAAKKSKAKRQNALSSWAKNVSLEIATCPHGAALDREVIDHFWQFRVYERGEIPDEFTLTNNARIAHVRHQYTNYEWLLLDLAGQGDDGVAYQILRERVDGLVKAHLGL